MSAATETPDISQLKAYALGLDSLDVRRQYQASTDQQPASNAVHRVASNSAGLRGTTQNNGQPPINLPGTVPETVKARMQAVFSQSPRDTQSASQWAYDALVDSTSGSNGSRGNGAANLPLIDKRMDVAEGDEINGLEGEGFLTSQINEEDDLSQDFRAEPFPETKRFRLPKTPASQSRKRKRASPPDGDDPETPLLPNYPYPPRQDTEGFMGPSQLFNTTQAQTSPAVVMSDSISERPSPNVQDMQRPSTAGTLSSPVPPSKSTAAPGFNEPRTTYISMKESQEARERRRQMREQELSPDELSDQEFAQPDSYIRRTLRRKKIDEAARQQFASLASRTQLQAPASIRKRKGRVQERTHSSPLRSERETNRVTIISDDGPQDDLPGSITEDETEREDVSTGKLEEDVEDVTEENKENIEVPMTESRDRGLRERNTTQSSPLMHPTLRSTRVTRASQSSLRSGAASAGPAGSEPYAVADSQPSQQRTRGAKAAAQGRLPEAPSSSTDSHAMIPQSQPSQDLSGKASAARDRESDILGPPSENGNPSESVASGKNATPNHLLHRPSNLDSSDLRTITDPSATKSSNYHNSPSLPLQTSQNVRGAKRATSKGSGGRKSNSSSDRAMTRTATSNSTALTQKASSVSTRFDTAREEARSSLPHESPVKPGNLESIRTKPEVHTRNETAEVDSEDGAFQLLGDDDLEFLSAMSKVSSRGPTPRKSKTSRRRRGLQATLGGSAVSRLSEQQISPGSPSRSAYSQLTPPKSSSQSTEAQTAPQYVGDVRRSPAARTTPPASQLDEGTMHEEQVSTEHITNSQFSDVVRRTERASTDAPNRVFARFNGRESNYYPATCVGATREEEPRYEVVFDDGNRSVVSPYGIKRLEFRIGDVCKVDIQGARTGSYVVRAVGGHITSQQWASPVPKTGELCTDRFGYTWVILVPKAGSKRRSVGQEDEDTDEIVVPIWRIYFTQTMWGNVKDRSFSFERPGLLGVSTPAERPNTPSTPSSRTKRARPSALNPARSFTAPPTPTNTLFNNMTFTLTNISSPSVLEQITRHIKTHGGRVLDTGFDELFNIPTLSRTTSPSKHDAPSFSLKPTSQDLGFVGLIADRHCRRAKYIQALALGIPCLATRWITDSLAKGTPQPLSAYLLPAGDSTFLNGAVRSRTLDPLPDPHTSTLRSIFDARPKMLENASVMLIMHKHEENTMTHHTFLTYALGAARVVRASGIEAAAKAVRDSTAGWDYVFSHDREREVERVIHGASGGGGGGGSRRKRRDGGLLHVAAATATATAAGDSRMARTRPRVVGNEYIIQSLILGRLVDG